MVSQKGHHVLSDFHLLVFGFFDINGIFFFYPFSPVKLSQLFLSLKAKGLTKFFPIPVVSL